MGLVVQHIFFELTHLYPLPRRIGLAQHSLVKLDLLRIVVVPVILAVNRSG